MSLARILEEDVVILIAIRGTPHLDEDVEIAIIIPVAACHRVPLLQVTRP